MLRMVATANTISRRVLATYRMRPGKFLPPPPAACTQHQVAIRQQIRSQQASLAAPRAAHSKLSRSPRSRLRSNGVKSNFRQSNQISVSWRTSRNATPSKAWRTSRRTARASSFREPRRCAGCGERGWRAAGELEGQTLVRALQPRGHTADRAPRPSRPAAALLLQSASLGLLPAIRERSGLRDWLRSTVIVSDRRRQRSSSAVIVSGRPCPHAHAHNATACPGHRSLQQHATACEHALPQPMGGGRQRHNLSVQHPGAAGRMWRE
jgi:hypothetical protein